jgi:rhodanese-related sulfurtransferase
MRMVCKPEVDQPLLFNEEFPMNQSANAVAVVPGSEFSMDLVPGNVKNTMKAIHASSSDLWKVPYGQIRILDGFNVRVRDEALIAHIRSTADSILANGFYPHSTLAGYVANIDGEQVVVLTDGHCRYEATGIAISEGAEVAELPIVISPKGTQLEDLTLGLITKNSGKRLSPFEEALVVKRLSAFGWDVAKIVVRTGFSASKVDGLLLLMAAPAQVRDMVHNGEVAIGEALRQLREVGSGAAAKLTAMKEDAKAKGHAKVTARNRPTASVQKTIRKEAPTMLQALRSLETDPGFASVSPELRSQIQVLLQKFVEKQPTDASAPAKTVSANQKKAVATEEAFA